MTKKIAFVFPGQGSQKVGMLQDLYNAYPIVKQRFEEADEALGYSISKLCFCFGTSKKFTALRAAAIINIRIVTKIMVYVFDSLFIILIFFLVVF